MPDAEIATLLVNVPEFTHRYLDLVAACDGDPGGPVVFTELADFVSELAAAVEQRAPLLTRCLLTVESVAQLSDEADELVGWAFLDSLSPDTLRELEPSLGTATRAVLDRLEEG